MPRCYIILALIAGSLAAEEGTAPPAGNQPPDRGAIFTKADADADGKLTLNEFLQGWRANEKNGPGGPGDGKMLDEIFAKADADGSGQISKEEFKAFHERMRERRQGGEGQGPGGPPGEGRGPGGDGQGRGPDGKGDGKGPPQRKDPREIFLHMDADQDGFVSRDEFLQFKPKPRPEGKPEGKPEGPPRE